MTPAGELCSEPGHTQNRLGNNQLEGGKKEPTVNQGDNGIIAMILIRLMTWIKRKGLTDMGPCLVRGRTFTEVMIRPKDVMSVNIPPTIKKATRK